MKTISDIVFFDTEVTYNGKLIDIGAINDKVPFHSADVTSFVDFSKKSSFLCGHNIVNFDYQYVKLFFELQNLSPILIDTLYWSPLLFPQNPYHNLVKDDKLDTDHLNNPCNDAQKAKVLFEDEVNAFLNLSEHMKKILYILLHKEKEFGGLFEYLEYDAVANLEELIEGEFSGKICANSDLSEIINKNPIELAYALSLINSQDKHSITPPWVLNRYPEVEVIVKKLCNTKCKEGCEYCKKHLDIKKQLKNFFSYDDYRKYDGENLQEQAVQAAVNNESLLAVFPTGGGKSVTFQVPALMAGENIRGLTVVISPLQSLMKDQVDNLRTKDISEAVTINGALNPIERAEAIKNVENGNAWLLYISPELLRSKTIENLLKKRNVVRFVIDEAHCFSAWGQDFRVDYLYIAKFIKKYKESKQIKEDIPVSCFTATAKQKVISDICAYFRTNLNIELKKFATTATRKNLHYQVEHVNTEQDKYIRLVDLINKKNCPTIVYVSTVKKTIEVAKYLNEHGIPALAYNGKMERNEKIDNQNQFMENNINVIVATSAFGMGVDKDNVGLVVHFEISDSIENYIQEAGRAGRNDNLDADCYVLFNENDLDKHFQLLNQTKLSINEIQQIWTAIKNFTKNRPLITKSPRELARSAGWNTEEEGIEIKVKNAVQALENAGYVERGNNVPHIYATDISVNNMQEGSLIIDRSTIFSDDEKNSAKKILKLLIGKKWRSKAGSDDAESRVDCIADILGIEKYVAIDLIYKMREHKILNDAEDMTAQIKQNDNISSTKKVLTKFYNLENYIIQNYEELNSFSYKSMNDKALKDGISSTIKDIKSILMYWRLSGIVGKKNSEDDDLIIFELKKPEQDIKKNLDFRHDLAEFIIEYLYKKNDIDNDGIKKNFSILELKDAYNNRLSLFSSQIKAETTDIKDTLNYLEKLNILDLSGGFLVFYNGLQIKKLQDNKIRYKKEDYASLNEHYQQKMQQIHIIGEYAHLMVENYERAQDFVFDYFNLDYQLFQRKYFKGNRSGEIKRNITPNKYNKLFGDLSQIQRNIIDDDLSQYIVVTAGPGSGKTKVLVHKLASLLLLEDIKTDKLLMLTFARSAATEFKERLVNLIGTVAHYVEIKTFHSYCFDLIGKIGNLDEIDNVVTTATNMIKSGEVEKGRITKSVLVIDEAQDISKEEYELIKSLIEANPDMRIIAVGDDDQYILRFREKNKEIASFNFLSEFKKDYTFWFNEDNNSDVKQYEMVDNYRSYQKIINVANKLIGKVCNRMKKNDVNPISDKLGNVIITKYKTPNLQQPTLNLIKNTYNNGTYCVLTRTNKEALNFVSLLVDNGYPAKLIQENEKFDLSQLFELNLLTKKIQNSCKTSLINKDIWDDCIRKFEYFFRDSSVINECKTLLNTFDKNYRTKYMFDFQMFLKESKLDDFVRKEDNIIYVSTLHKSKGREFDNVYIMLNNFKLNDDDALRLLYVGMTRAKKSLYINYNNDIFDDFDDKSIELKLDANNYPEYQKIILELGHDDVYLGHFDFDNKNKDNQEQLKKLEEIEHKTDETIKDITKYKSYIERNNIIKDKIYNIKTGDKLIWNDGYLEIDRGDKAIRLSQKALNEINELNNNGYILKDAKVRFKVYWQNKERTQKGLIILPTLYFDSLKTTVKKEVEHHIFQKGDIVVSEHFGIGTITNIDNEIATVLFNNGETKIHIDYITKK